MEMDKKQKFDGYAAQYDEWFMENDRLFTSELRLFMKVLGDIKGKRLLSVGCGSGLFESYIDCSGVEGIEPSRDMGEIAVKRGVNVIKFGLIEDVDARSASCTFSARRSALMTMNTLRMPCHPFRIRSRWLPPACGIRRRRRSMC